MTAPGAGAGAGDAGAGDAPPPSGAARAVPWLAVAALGLVTQTLAAAPALWVGSSDGACYAALARAAPGRDLYDGRPYVLHPPLHPLLVRAVAGLGGLPCDRAGVVLAGLSTVGLGLLTFGLARAALASTAGGLVAATVLLASRGAVVLGQGEWREPVQTLAGLGLLACGLLGEGRRASAGAALLGAASGLLWDPLVALAGPLGLGAAWLRRRPAAAGLAALALTWGGWAVHRHATVTATPEFPAGIDGLVEDTAAAGPGAFFNPNLFARTARHNAFFWPAAATPLRPLELAAPALLDDDPPHLGYAPGPAVRAATLVVLGLGLGGLVVLARRPPPAARAWALVGAGLLVLGAPACGGLTPRYGYAWLPLVAGLVGALAARGAAARRGGEARARAAALALVALAAAAWPAARRQGAWTRPQRFDGEGVVALLEGVAPLASDLAVAAPVGLVPDLCWRLPGRRIVTLPLDAGVEGQVEGRRAPLVVVPRGLAPLVRPGVPAAVADEAQGLPALRAVHAAAREGRARWLGAVLEAEVTDRARARAWDVFWLPGAAPGAAGPAPFQVLVEPGAVPALRAALDGGDFAPAALRGLDADALAAALRRAAGGDAAAGEAAAAVLAAARR